MMINKKLLGKIINLALEEDLRDSGDITTSSTIDPNKSVKFSVNAREDLVLCCQPIAEYIFREKNIDFSILKKDGELVKKGETIIAGNTFAIKLLPIERVLLNFIQHLSGVASITRKFVDRVMGLNAIIRDTRKTTPGMRDLEKYAVNLGGGESYRNSLSDKILIKDNHIASCGGVKEAILQVRKKLGNVYIAVECDSFEQLTDAIDLNAEMALLDNMNIEQLSKCVKFARDKKSTIKLEASGSVNFDNVAEIAETGVDYISIGMLTHSAPSKDIGIDIENPFCL